MKTELAQQRLKQILFFLVLMLFWGCEKEVKLKLGNEHDDAINCVLNPDSAFMVKITKTAGIDFTGEFTPVTDAHVTISNGKTEFALMPTKGGVYVRNEKPVSGQEYTLRVKTAQGEDCSATTKIPQKPLVTITFNKENFVYTLKINDNPLEKNYYWISAHEGWQYWHPNYAPKIYFNVALSLFSNSTLCDSFNRKDSNYYRDFNYFFFNTIRIDDQLYNGKEIVLDFRTDKDLVSLSRIMVVSADENLDRYLKTGLLQRDQKASGDNPVFMIPISMFTNVENAKGIFGSCSISEHIFKF